MELIKIILFLEMGMTNITSDGIGAKKYAVVGRMVQHGGVGAVHGLLFFFSFFGARFSSCRGGEIYRRPTSERPRHLTRLACLILAYFFVTFEVNV